MGTVKIKPFRKNENGSLDKLLFSSTASYVDMEGFVRYTDAELVGNIPTVDLAPNVLLAFKYLDGTTRKALLAKADISSLATVATSGSYLDLLNRPTIPTSLSELTNDVGYITGVAWNDVADKPSSFTPSAHTHTTAEVTALTGYEKAATAAEIAATDTLNIALGKIQKTLDAKQNSVDPIASAIKASKDGAGNTITETYATKQEVSGIPKFKIEVVQALPAVGDAATIYLLLTGDESQNLYTEYIYVNNAWEKLGTQTVDLSAYALKSEIPVNVSELVNDAQYVVTGEKVVSATLADSATVATNDSRNQQIDTTYIKGISVDGTTVTITKGNGTTSTVTTQDTTYSAATTNDLGLVKIGANITNNNGSLSLTQTNITSALGYTPPTQDTTYGIATDTNPGLMDTTDRTKLDGIESGANNYVLPAATNSDLGGVKVGNNIAVALDGTISIGKNNVTAALGYTPPEQDTTYNPATTTVDGLMSSADKVKLNGIEAGANNYVLPATNGANLGGVIVGENITVNANGVISLTGTNVTSALGYTPPQQDTTYNPATTTVDGLMSSTDKAKLDGIENNANNYSLPEATSSTLGGVKVGSNISVANDGTISLTSGNVTSALGYAPPRQDTTYDTMTAAEIEAGTSTTPRVVNAKVVADYVTEQVVALDTGVMSVTEGSTNGTIDVDGTDVAVHGLGSAAYTASTAYAPASHNQAANTINAMTGYSKASSASAIVTTDTLNTAIGKLEKALDGKQASGDYAPASHNQAANTINAMTGYSKPSSTSAISTSDNLNTAIGKLEKALDNKQPSGNYLPADGTAVKATADASGNVITTTYATKAEVSTIPKFKIEVVQSLPATGDAATIYLVVSGDESQNLYTEYIYVNNAWEKLGTQTVDLSDYALKSEIPTAVSDLDNDLNFVTPSGSVAYATAATKDANNQTIASTYIKEVSVSGTTVTLKKGDNTTSTVTTQDTTYDVATTSKNGLMSSTDKSKLDGIENGANNYSLPAASSSNRGGVKVGNNISVTNDGTISLTSTNVKNALGYTPPTTDTTYDPMSASEISTGTSTVSRVMTAKVISDYVTGAINGIDTGVMSVTEGSSNGTISVDGSPVSVHGLGSAAYTASTAYAPASHNQAANTINAMTGYSKASSTSAITTTDTLNTAIGKLEKALDGKQPSGNYLLDTATAADSSKLGGVAASSYALAANIPTKVSDLTNDSGFLTDVDWSDIDNIPSSFTPSAHNQAANTINLMTGYSKPSSSSAIAATDTLNTAIGKLEKALDDKQAAGDYAPASHNQAANTINAMTGYSKPSSTSAIGTSDTLNVAIGKLEKALDGKQASGDYAPASHNQAANTINAMTGYSKPSSTGAISTSDTLNAAIGKLEKALDGKQAILSAMTASEATTGTSTTARSITAKVLADYVASQISEINTGVMSVTTGSSNGTISVDGSPVSVYGLGSAAYTASTAYATATHNHPSSQVNLMTGYSKPSTTSAIETTDTLNGAIGKLEKALDGKQASGDYAAASHTHNYAGSSSAGGAATSATKLATARAIDGVNFDGSAAIVHYGTCSTAAGTAAKTVACTSFTLVTGSRIIVKFTVTNTAANPTLNVNSTGAKAIQYRGAAITAGYLAANRTYEFIYDGTNYQLVGDIDTNTTYSAGTGMSLSGTTFNHSNSVTAGTAGTSSATSGSTLAVPYVTYDEQGHVTATGTHTHTVTGFLTAHQTIKQDAVTGATGNRFGTCATAAATAAKAVSITAGTPTLEAGLKVTVKFTYANTANSPTLNVNSLGAKNIFHNGAQITSGANKALLAGACDFVYDGTQFHLVGNYIDTNTQTITGVKGNSESSYRTGNVNLTAANIGALASNETAADSSKLGGIAASSYALAASIPTKVSDLANDSGFITGVGWDDVTNKPGTFTPAAHNQASNTINAMTGYSKPSSTSAIGTSDTLNAAIGKLEKALDGKAAVSHDQASNTINAMTGYAKPSSTSAIGTSDTLNAAIGKLEKALDGKLGSSETAADSSKLGNVVASSYALKTDIPSVWDSNGHLVSPSGWQLWITDEDEEE